MGDILSKLQMVSEKIGVTETAHTIEEQVDLISESLDKIPHSTNIAEALDDLSDVAQNINNEEVYVDKTITENGTYLPAEDEATAYSKIVANIPPHFSRVRVSVPYKSSGEVVLDIVNMYTSTDGIYEVSTDTKAQKAVLCNPAQKIEIGNMLEYTAVIFTPDDNFDGFYVNGSKITPTGDNVGSKNSSDTYFGTTTGEYGRTTGINIIKTSDPQFSFTFNIY